MNPGARVDQGRSAGTRNQGPGLRGTEVSRDVARVSDFLLRAPDALHVGSREGRNRCRLDDGGSVWAPGRKGMRMPEPAPQQPPEAPPLQRQVAEQKSPTRKAFGTFSGAFNIISQSLGLEVGGGVGAPLYLSQAPTVSMYIFGFRARWLWIFRATPSSWWIWGSSQSSTSSGSSAPASPSELKGELGFGEGERPGVRWNPGDGRILPSAGP